MKDITPLAKKVLKRIRPVLERLKDYDEGEIDIDTGNIANKIKI